MKYPIELELTDNCLLRCSCCPNRSYENKGFMTFDKFKLIVDYLLRNLDNISFLDLSGIGDIFLHPNIDIFFLHLLKKFANTGLDILIPTKGNSVTNKHIDILKRCYFNGLNFNLSVGIYSLRSYIHKKISGVNNLNIIINFIKKIKKEGIPISLELVVNKYSINELNYFYKLGNSLGVNYKVHNYHNFGGLIKSREFGAHNSLSYKSSCSFSDSYSPYEKSYCTGSMPFISKEGYLYLCTHGGKQERFKLGSAEFLFNKFSNYIDLVNYINYNKVGNVCNGCTYFESNIL